MTEATLTLCRNYVTLCEQARAKETEALAIAQRLIPMWHELNQVFAQEIHPAELEQRCKDIIQNCERLNAD